MKEQNTTPENLQNNKKRNLVIGIVSAIILAIILYFLFYNKQEKTPAENTLTQKDSLKKELYYLIQSEDTCHPYSDAKLTEILSSQFGRTFSRRLIQKYRTELHILNSYERYK